MTDVADRFVVLLDANVLFPFRVRDALLRFAEAGLYRARWSAQILEEWESNLIKKKPHLAESIKSQLKAMKRTFPESLVVGFEPLMEGLDLPDENDRHVLAAAIQCGAQHIITENLKDFPLEVLEPLDLEAVSADTFLASTFELYPSEAIAALRKMREAYKNPGMSKSEFLLDLTGYGMVKTASLAKSEIECL